MTEKSIIHEIAANLAQAAEEQIKKIPEDVFAYHFLPIFCGEKSPSGATAAMWEQIAGNAFQSVDVTDTKTGEVIYRVPSLYDMDGLEVGRRHPNSSPMTHVLITMQQMARNSPTMASRYLQHQLSLRNLTRVSPELTKRVEQLNIIFQRYNKPLISLDATGTQTYIDPTKKLVDGTSSGEPDLVYD